MTRNELVNALTRAIKSNIRRNKSRKRPRNSNTMRSTRPRLPQGQGVKLNRKALETVGNRNIRRHQQQQARRTKKSNLQMRRQLHPFIYETGYFPPGYKRIFNQEIKNILRAYGLTNQQINKN